MDIETTKTETTETETETTETAQAVPVPAVADVENEPDDIDELDDEETPTEIAERVAAKAVLVSVSVGSFGVRRKIETNRVAVDGEKVGETISSDVVSATKKLLKCPEYEAIERLDGAFYSRMMSRVLSGAYRKGVYHLPLALLEWFEEVWTEYVAERAVLVEAFVSVYDLRVNEAASKLGVLFDRSQYPGAGDVRSRFTLNRSYQQVGVPGALADLNMGLFEAERAKLQAQMAEAALECRNALRVGLLELVAHLRDRLEPGEDGKAKRLHTSTVEGLREWLDLFAARDITGDRDLADVVEDLRGIMDGVDQPTLKENADVAVAVRDYLKITAEQIKTMTTPSRRFDFSE